MKQSLILFLFILSIIIRLILAWQTYDNPLFMFNSEFISILTPDAALYGYYTQLLLDGLAHKTDVSMIEYIIYFSVKVTPFTLDQVLYFGPAFFTSLIIIPVYLTMSLFINSKSIIFLSSIIASVGYGLYSRSYLGYFDTDVLNTFFPMMILYSMLLVIKKDDYRYALFGVIFNMAYLFWYHSSEPIIYALNGFFILFSILFYRKSTELYKVYILFGISIIKLSILYKLLILFIVFGGLYYLKIDYKYFLTLFLLSFLAILYKIDLSQFSFHMNRYLFKAQTIENANYNFLAPMQYVAEAMNSDFLHTVQLISGNILIFMFSLIGYIFLTYKHKNFLLSLPLVVLGFMSIQAGIRFHIYAIAPLIISYGYLVYFLSEKITSKSWKILFIGALFILPIYENYRSIMFWNTQVAKPIFNNEQVKALEMLKEVSSKKDYVVTWWDYGWPVWYYTNMQTMIDNGRHHEDNYSVAKILMSTSQKFSYNAIHHLYDLYSKQQSPAIIQALRKEKNMNALVKKLENKDMVHKSSVDKYLVLPQQMTELIYTIFTFSNIDPQTGKKLPQKIFFEYNIIKEDKDFVYLDKNVKIDKSKALVIQSERKIPIKKFYDIVFTDSQKLLGETDVYQRGLNLVKYNNKYYFMDDYFLNTTFIQLMFFNNYDKKYFEPVYTGKSISIFKVK